MRIKNSNILVVGLDGQTLKIDLVSITKNFEKPLKFDLLFGLRGHDLVVQDVLGILRKFAVDAKNLQQNIKKDDLVVPSQNQQECVIQNPFDIYNILLVALDEILDFSYWLQHLNLFLLRHHPTSKHRNVDFVGDVIIYIDTLVVFATLIFGFFSVQLLHNYVVLHFSILLVSED